MGRNPRPQTGPATFARPERRSPGSPFSNSLIFARPARPVTLHRNPDMQAFEPSELKALFDQLVSAVGTQEAAATFLGVSRQRVGQLVSPACSDLPTWGQVAKLESVVGVSIVFGALARRAGGDGASDALTAAVDATSAQSCTLSTIHAARADGHVDDKEAAAIIDRARVSLERAQRQYDAALEVRPSLRVVS